MGAAEAACVRRRAVVRHGVQRQRDDKVRQVGVVAVADVRRGGVGMRQRFAIRNLLALPAVSVMARRGRAVRC